MKSNITDMEAKMSSLSQTLAKITSCSDKINQTLDSRRDKLETLSGVHGLLEKLQFLMDLPARLRRAIDEEAYTQAVNFYEQTASVLETYSYVPQLKPIKGECEAIIQQLIKTVTAVVQHPDSSIAKSIGLPFLSSWHSSCPSFIPIPALRFISLPLLRLSP